MPWIIDVKDKSGRTIHLSNERWKHIQRHPEMSDSLEQIKEALQNPDVIKEFVYDPDV